MSPPLRSPDACGCSAADEPGRVEMMYYDELARQDEQVLLTLTMDEEAVAACAERDPADDAAAAAVRTKRLVS